MNLTCSYSCSFYNNLDTVNGLPCFGLWYQLINITGSRRSEPAKQFGICSFTGSSITASSWLKYVACEEIVKRLNWCCSAYWPVLDIKSWMQVRFLSRKSVSAGAASTDGSNAEISEAEGIVYAVILMIIAEIKCNMSEKKKFRIVWNDR